MLTLVRNTGAVMVRTENAERANGAGHRIARQDGATRAIRHQVKDG